MSERNAILKKVVDGSLRKICYYERMCKLMHFHMLQWTRTQHIFQFSRSGKREFDVNRLLNVQT